MAEEQRPRIGVGVLVLKNGKVLMHYRKGAHGAGSWSFPGGHLEFGETLVECAKREVFEEAGIKVKNVRPAQVYTDDFFRREGKHYITLLATADYASGKPRVLEKNYCGEWKWFEWGKFPKPLFLPLKNLLNQKYNPFK